MLYPSYKIIVSTNESNQPSFYYYFFNKLKMRVYYNGNNLRIVSVFEFFSDFSCMENGSDFPELAHSIAVIETQHLYTYVLLHIIPKCSWFSFVLFLYEYTFYSIFFLTTRILLWRVPCGQERSPNHTR